MIKHAESAFVLPPMIAEACVFQTNPFAEKAQRFMLRCVNTAPHGYVAVRQVVSSVSNARHHLRVPQERP